MGTRLDVLFSGVENSEGQEAFERIYGIVSRLEHLLSRFDENSPLSRLNRLAARKAMAAEEELFHVLTLCRDYYQRTCGLFDVGIGKVTSMIREGRSDPGSVLEWLRRSGMERVELDPEKRTVHFFSDAVEIDLGGFGKGFALGKVMSSLNLMGISNAFISFGDSSILALGSHPHGHGWKSGINHLFKPGESLYVFDLMNESLSTSGTIPGARRSGLPAHILHPVRGTLDPGMRCMSVASSLATDAEVLSTALLAASAEERDKTLEHFPGCRAVEVSYGGEGKASVQILTQTQVK
jgi:thiamine biosynthesis lipoprotein